MTEFLVAFTICFSGPPQHCVFHPLPEPFTRHVSREACEDSAQRRGVAIAQAMGSVREFRVIATCVGERGKEV